MTTLCFSLPPTHCSPQAFTPTLRLTEAEKGRGGQGAKMSFNFTGSLTERRINLGSAHQISSSQLAQQAREERALRQEIRLRHAAATKIQSTFRGRKDVQNQRQAVYLRLQGHEADDFVQATRLVSIATRRRAITAKIGKSASIPIVSKAEEAALNNDDVVLKAWAARALQLLPNSSEFYMPPVYAICPLILSRLAAPQLLAPLLSHNSQGYKASLTSILDTLLCHFQFQGAAAQAGYASYFSVLSLLMSPSAQASAPGSMALYWCSWLVGKGLYHSLQIHLMKLVSRSVANIEQDTELTRTSTANHQQSAIQNADSGCSAYPRSAAHFFDRLELR
jgi:hypothetical protein